MWNAVLDDTQADYWPPRPSRFWRAAFEPFRRFYLRRYYRIAEVSVEGLAPVLERFHPDDAVLLAPNHSHDSDPHVMMEVGRQVGRPIAFMAAWQIFRTHWGIDGWVLQRMGAFSVDREGCDRRAIRQAVEVLSNKHALVVFPEGEIYHLNDRLTPLLEGVAFMALTAQRELEKTLAERHVWVVPTAICYRYLDDVTPKPGDYLSEKPSVERMAETVEKFEEDMTGFAKPKGRRRARVLLGEPIDLKEAAAGRARTAAHDVTVRLEEAIGELMKRVA